MKLWIGTIVVVSVAVGALFAADAPGPATKQPGEKSELKFVTVAVRSGAKERGVEGLRKGDSAIIFKTSTGQKIEVDLLETPRGKLLLRAHGGELTVVPGEGTLEVSVDEKKH